MGPISKKTAYSFRNCVIVFLLLATCYGVALGNFTCPDLCHCDLTQNRITCTNALLQDIPENLPESITHLNLSNNIICETNTSLKYLVNLEVLDLSHNCLTTVMNTGIQTLANLEELHLEDNQLTSSDLSPLVDIESLLVLNLAHNKLTSLADFMLLTTTDNTTVETPSRNLSQLNYMNISFNKISHLPLTFLSDFSVLRTFDISNNQLETIAHSDHTISVHVLDLSANLLADLGQETFQGLDNLLELNLAHNLLQVWEPVWAADMAKLNRLILSDTAIGNISAAAFAHSHSLRYLELNFMQRLWFLDPSAFEGLDQLTHLQLRGNVDLSSIPSQLLQPLHHLVEVDISHNNLNSIPEHLWVNLTALQSVALHGNPFLCDCHITWLKEKLSNSAPPDIVNQEQIICNKPHALYNTPLSNSSLINMTCAGANIIDFPEKVYFPIGKAAVLDCLAEGSPQPDLTWITPREIRLKYDPAFGAAGRLPPHEKEFHYGHHWHNKRDYFVELPPHERVHILRNGSLYIDYVQRIDGGPYRCIAHNKLGNDTIVIDFKLNYDIIYYTKVWSIFFGFCCALVFLFISVIFATVRHFATTCTPEHQQKRKTLRELIDGLDAYKTAQFERINAYKSAKFDQFSAFKTDRVHRLKMRMLTMQTIVDYMKGMRQHYHGAVNRIKDNCTQQADKLRDQYSNKMGQFKDYRSHQIEKIRDNYSQQVMKVREYGTQQVEKLREQYKLQQQHILKLLEILDIGNCMTVIEAECMRTESMIFDPDFYLSLDTHPVHILPHHLHSDSENADSEYETASQSSKVNIPDCDITLDLPPLEETPVFTIGTADLPGVHLFLPHEKPPQQRRTRKHRSRSHPRSRAPRDDDDEEDVNGTGQKVEKPHRKRRHRKPRNASQTKERGEGSNETSQGTSSKSNGESTAVQICDATNGDNVQTQPRRRPKRGRRRRPKEKQKVVIEHPPHSENEPKPAIPSSDPRCHRRATSVGSTLTPSEYETPQGSRGNSPETEQPPVCREPMVAEEEAVRADHVVVIDPDQPEKYANVESTV